ncbi:hypothetical protein B9Z19DRAFT_1069945 [Tuber borchii]|uniref:Uncharacterized protein n=1 Tax=Tuber borchii TaxID=42251 RepID=A0A2T6Z9M6_TUBBO|nr:hypothetical protein B9Z19DRAFT_1069945 [Tuber borchii]
MTQADEANGLADTAESPRKLQVRISPEYLLMLSSEAQHPADNVVVNMIIVEAHNVIANMPVVEARQESGQAATPSASSYKYSIPGSNLDLLSTDPTEGSFEGLVFGFVWIILPVVFRSGLHSLLLFLF